MRSGISWTVRGPQQFWLKSFLGPSEHCGSLSTCFTVLCWFPDPCVYTFLLQAAPCLLAPCLNRALLIHLAHRFLTHPCSSLLRMALAPTSMVWAPALEVQRMKSSMLSFRNLHFETQIAQTPTHMNWVSRIDSHIAKTLGYFATRIAEMEQNFSALTARMCKVETYAASASKKSGSARSWP